VVLGPYWADLRRCLAVLGSRGRTIVSYNVLYNELHNRSEQECPTKTTIDVIGKLSSINRVRFRICIAMRS